MFAGDELFNFATTIVLSVLLMVAVATDLKSHRIPNLILLPAFTLALVFHATTAGTEGLITAIAGLTIGLAMLMPLYAIGGMGAGDVKLLGVVGSFLGPWGAVVAGLATMMAGAVLGLAVILWQRFWPLLQPHAAQLLGPRLSSATFPAAKLVHGGSRTTEIAYAPAIAAGTGAALWYIDQLPAIY